MISEAERLEAMRGVRVRLLFFRGGGGDEIAIYKLFRIRRVDQDFRRVLLWNKLGYGRNGTTPLGGTNLRSPPTNPYVN